MKAIISKVLMILKHLFFRLHVAVTLHIGHRKEENHSDADCNSNYEDIEDNPQKGKSCDEEE